MWQKVIVDSPLPQMKLSVSQGNYSVNQDGEGMCMLLIFCSVFSSQLFVILACFYINLC